MSASDPAPDPPDGLERGLSEASESRLSSALSALEGAATEILDEAEGEARRRLEAAEAEAARITRERAAEAARQSDTLIASAETVRDRADELLAAIDRALADVDAPVAVPSVPSSPTEDSVTPPPPDAPEPLVASESQPAEAPPASGGGAPPEVSPAAVAGPLGGASEGAILLATQMAVSGATREQIESRLRDDFGISDPTPILDDLNA